MGGNIPIDIKVNCPFYDRNVNGCSLRCESTLKAAVFDTVTFENADKKHRYMKKHCFFSDGKGCERARLLFEKYAEES